MKADVTEHGAFGSDDLVRLKAILAGWRKDLIDMSGRNRLLNFRHTKSATLEIKQPGADELVAALTGGEVLPFAPLPEEPGEDAEVQPDDEGYALQGLDDADGIVTQKVTATALLRSLRGLRSKSVQLFNDYGLWTLHLGVGLLRWRDDGSSTFSNAPLMLYPVELFRTDGRFLLRANHDEEPRINPALGIRLEPLGVDWSPVAECDSRNVGEVLEAVERAVSGKPDWEVSDLVVLALFASHKEVMYQDLLENEQHLLRSDLVRAVALGAEAALPPDRFDFDEVPLTRIDDVCPPEDTPLVLDADASQRQAVAAAVQGHSFVLDGPPGTGKSQTITNIIAALMHAGRSVLFVSEKAAALDVVYDRLVSVGLDSYVLPLHSHHTSRKAVAHELARALAEEPHASPLPQHARVQVQADRLKLSSYAEAMNETRQPLGRSLHDVIGRFGQLAEAPVVYSTLPPPGDGPDGGFHADRLSSQDFDAILSAAGAISASWQAVADPAFPWRDLRSGQRHPATSLEQASAALDSLMQAARPYEDLNATSAPYRSLAEVDRLVRLLSLLDTRAGVPEWWLTAHDAAEQVEGPLEAFVRKVRDLRRIQTSTTRLTGPRWEELSPRLQADPGDDERRLADVQPAGLRLDEFTEDAAESAAAAFDAAAARLDDADLQVRRLTEQLGAEKPQTIDSVRALCALADLADAAYRPLAEWFAPHVLDDLEQSAVAAVAAALDEFAVRKDRVIAARQLALRQAGPYWGEISPELPHGPGRAETGLADLCPPGLDMSALRRDELDAAAKQFHVLAALLESAAHTSRETAPRIGCPPPRIMDEVADLAELISLATRPHRALPRWLTPGTLESLRTAANEVRQARAALDSAQRAAAETFAPVTPLTQGVVEAVTRLQQTSRRFAAGLSSQVRADRKFIGGLTTEGQWGSHLEDRLHLAVAWHEAHTVWQQAVRTHHEFLGEYLDDDLPDMDALEAAVHHAEDLHRLAAGALAEPESRRLVERAFCDGAVPPADVIRAGAELRHAVDEWYQALSGPRFAARRDDMAGLEVTAAVTWLRAHCAPLEQAADLVGTVEAAARRDTPDTLASARMAVLATRDARRETDAFEARQRTDQALLSTWYRGLDTETTRLGQGDGAETDPRTASLLRRAVSFEASTTHRQDPEPDVRLLGRYATDGHPDTVALAHSLSVLADVQRLAPSVLAAPDRRVRLVEALADGRSQIPGLSATVLHVREACDNWQQLLSRPYLLGTRGALFSRTFRECAEWLRMHIDPLRDAAHLIHSVARVSSKEKSHETPLTLADARAVVAAVRVTRAAEERFLKDEAADVELLGALYQGVRTGEQAVLDAFDWAQQVRRTAGAGVSSALTDSAAHLLLSAAPDPSVALRVEEWRTRADLLADHFEPQRTAELRNLFASDLQAVRALLDRMAQDPYGPETWLSAAEARKVLERYGLARVPDQLAGRNVDAARFPDALERAVLQVWLEHQMATDERLRPLSSAEHDQVVARYRAADRELVHAAHATVIAACNLRRPRRITVGPAATIIREGKKQKRHMPVRRLLAMTREVAQRIKPCFMMSPLTVSQFLPPDFRFDVVIFDEASQVLPQDAVNSVYRGDALIVAGDPRQLPPTSFFAAGTDAEDDEWDEEGIDRFESVLDACTASGILREIQLRWHYRSRHENLIAFSNHEFYDNSMTVFPGPAGHGDTVGVEFFKADGVYDRGNKSNNVREAELVAQRVIHHFATRPRLTLGVVALSRAQADAIEEAVSSALARRPDIARHVTEDRLNGFFVKNLENVQGDERDVIILSVGYGRDAQGKLAASFGPINRESGWRRLNVAVTRARYRMEVVASFNGGELPDSANKSVQHLKRYLQYALLGPDVLQTAAVDADAAPESPFEEDVLDTLRRWNYDVQPQVGVAGFRIDLGVRHPDAPGSYAIGIECDGAMYHSSRTARDRDRLREEILRGLGWRLHRIWGTDWYRNRKDAERRLREAVEAACTAPPPGTATEAPAAQSPQAAEETSVHAETLIRHEQATSSVRLVPVMEIEDRPWSKPYRAFQKRELLELREVMADRYGLHWLDLREPGAQPVVAAVAEQVIAVEGPIEEELLIARVREAWNVDKSGTLVQNSVRRALNVLQGKGTVVRNGTSWNVAGRTVDVARTPSETCNRKKVAQVPPEERQVALFGVLSESPGLHREELARETARFFGWQRLGSDIRAALEADMDALIARNAMAERDNGLVCLTGLAGV
ncbi:DUF3320 domain-containing protein [Streptomyces sp. HPF1205]|uniref:DUF3320 domain-containing protein n=1 Tax=Streptomyces sp. HPF1205 TaxID=2873262 RepID=UPI001CED9632|nr:DUF3320 domain-containing protein [Streptomyces sp. HPF1205]